MSPLREQDRKDMLEILDDRYRARCTILTSQLPVSTWHDYVGRPHADRHQLRPNCPQLTPHCTQGPNQEKTGNQEGGNLTGKASLRSVHITWNGCSR